MSAEILSHDPIVDRWCGAVQKELPFPTKELSIAFPELLPAPVRLLECSDGAAADEVFYGLSEEDSTGAKVWPLAYLCAVKLLELGVKDCSVLELGCGCGLVSIAARSAGARVVVATDRSVPNLQLVSASAALSEASGKFAAELFDVDLKDLTLLRQGAAKCGNDRLGPYTAACAHWLPGIFDYVVCSDVLYEKDSACIFGVRVAQALAAGSTVIIADAMREWESFEAGLRKEAERLDITLPPVLPKSVVVPDYVNEWCCIESSGEKPWLLVLRPVQKMLCESDVALLRNVRQRVDADDQEKLHVPSRCTLQIPQWHPEDLQWYRPGKSFECRVDNALLASWCVGQAAVNQEAYVSRVAAVKNVLSELLLKEEWTLRKPAADWVKWVPRELNVMADSLANMCIDRGCNIAVRGLAPQISCTNFVTLSDGACRSSAGRVSASWCIIAFTQDSLSLVAAGGVCLPPGTTSLDAELTGLELAIGALLKCSRGYSDLQIHSADLIINASDFLESNGHWLAQPAHM